MDGGAAAGLGGGGVRWLERVVKGEGLAVELMSGKAGQCDMLRMALLGLGC